MCIFCEIAKHNINSYKVYEDDLFLAFLDLSQATKGHTLIIPKKHYENIYELGDEEGKNLTKVIQVVATKLKDTLKCDGINILNNCGEVAGQSVMHFHVHLIPQYKKDIVKIVPDHDTDAKNYIEQTANLLK